MDKEEFIRQVARENARDETGSRILWSRHATAALIDDQLRRHDVETGLIECILLEDYPQSHRRLPDCLILIRDVSNSPIHAVTALDLDNARLFIVTVYRPSEDRWQNDWQTRRND